MDFGLASLRKLIEDFLTNTGGRRGRQREAQRQNLDEEFGDDNGEASAAAADADATASTTTAPTDGDEPAPAEAEDADGEDGGGGGGFFSRGSSDDDIDDIYHRLEELETELDDKDSELGAVQDSQEHVAEQVEEMNDRVQRLLGVYDQVTDDVNPFTGDGEAESGFGVFGEDDKRADGVEEGFELESDDEDQTVSFDDLKGVIDEASTDATDGETITFDEDDADDTTVEVRPTDSVDEPDEEDKADDAPEDVTLTALADTYATDVIVFEWLTQLVRTGGSAETLRAISYYHEIGWIDEAVKGHLEAVLSGPDLDIHVDPEQPPEELTAEDHADSYTYIMKLQEIHEIQGEVEPNATTEPESEFEP